MAQLKLGNIQVIFSIRKIFEGYKTIYVLSIIFSSKLKVFLKLRSRKGLFSRRQTSERIFHANGGYCWAIYFIYHISWVENYTLYGYSPPASISEKPCKIKISHTRTHLIDFDLVVNSDLELPAH